MDVPNTEPRPADEREIEMSRLRLFAAIIESSEDAIVSKDLDGLVTSWNRGAERLYGYTADEIIGQPVSLLTHSSRPDEVRLMLERVRRGERVQRYETLRVKKGGGLVSISLTESPLYDSTGAVVGASAIARDNTERQRADEKALELSLYARRLIEASLDPLVTIRADGKITDVNEATIKVTGVEREWLIGTDFSDYFTEPAKAGAGYREAFSEGSVTDYPLTIRHRDGHLTDVLYNATLYKDASGQPLGIFAAARDVTAQKQASQYARSLIEASLDPLVTISPAGKITDVNAATVKVTGVLREHLVGTDFSDYFTEPERAREGYRQVFAEGSVTDYPLTIRHEGGSLTDVLYNASVYADAHGDVLGVFAAARDVTARRRAEAEVANQRTKELERIAELERFQKLTVGRELKMIELQGDRGAEETGEPLSWLEGSEATVEFSTQDHVNALLNILDDSGAERERLHETQRTILNILDDLDVEKRSAQTANRMKSEFLANMSHELRTPLNAIIGFAKLMAQGKVGPVSAQHQEYLGDILKSSSHLLQLINDVLDLAKVESGKLEFYPEPIVVSRLIREVSNILRPMAAAKQIHIEFAVDPSCEALVLDPGKLKQVLYNYLSNAIKFTHASGRVVVRAGAEDTATVRIEVEDTGIGIRPEDLKLLFTEFHQLDSGASKHHQGTGLGLALTKRIVEAQGGQVGVASVAGSGSVFFAVLPRTHTAIEELEDGEHVDPNCRR